jgi:hypothetical protein
MAKKVYIGDNPVIEIDCGEDITEASALTLQVRKPDKSIVVWIPETYGTTKLRYQTAPADLDVKGDYLIQPRLTIDGWTGRGDTVTLTVFPLFG